ncbi:MAG: hypothetical protein WA304_14425 [Candidatus Cybelea sp.]
MLLAIVTAFVICPTAAPSPMPLASPLQEIGHVRATLLCSGLRNKIGPSISGLRVNDAIISQGQVMMAKLRSDALADPRGASATGGAGASSEMDDFQMARLVQALTKNLGRVEALLNDPLIFPNYAGTDDEHMLDLAKSRLEAVAAGQWNILNILSETLQSNETNDLISKCDPVDCPSGGVAPVRLSLPRALTLGIRSEQHVEGDVAPAIVALIQRCLQK